MWEVIRAELEGREEKAGCVMESQPILPVKHALNNTYTVQAEKQPLQTSVNKEMPNSEHEPKYQINTANANISTNETQEGFVSSSWCDFGFLSHNPNSHLVEGPTSGCTPSCTE